MVNGLICPFGQRRIDVASWRLVVESRELDMPG